MPMPMAPRPMNPTRGLGRAVVIDRKTPAVNATLCGRGLYVRAARTVQWPGRTRRTDLLAELVHRRLCGAARGIELRIAQVATLAVRFRFRTDAASSCSCRSARVPSTQRSALSFALSSAACLLIGLLRRRLAGAAWSGVLHALHLGFLASLHCDDVRLA